MKRFQKSTLLLAPLALFVLSKSLGAYTLDEILASQRKDNITKSIEAKRDANIAKSELITSYDAPRFGMSVAHAKEPQQEGLEYSLGVSQNLKNPFANDTKESVSQNLSNAIIQETKHELHIRELDIASKYYASCSAKELELESLTLLKEQKKRVAKLKSAYELGEISKKELLFAQLDLAGFHKKSKSYQRAYLEEFASLQSRVSDLELESIACSDIEEPKRYIEIKSLSEHGELQRLEYQKNAADASSVLYSSLFEDIGYEFLYENEVQTKRYRLGVTIPLSQVTSQQELYKTQELQASASYNYAKEALANEIRSSSKKLLRKIEVIYDEYMLLKNDVLPISEELFELCEYAYEEGEGTLLEQIDSLRSYSQNRLDMLEIKKMYYHELFELYKITDMEFGESICTK